MPLVIAHRGASAYAPENTIPAFELAIQQHADMLELDVQRSSDGILVVFHDETTERWDGRHRPVATCSLAELRTLDIGGAHIATLAEVCSLAREHNIRLNVELKALGIGAQVAHLLHTENVAHLTLISSFSPDALREVQTADPHLPRAYLMGTQTYSPNVRLREAWPFQALRSIDARAWHPAYQLPLLSWIIPRVQRAGYQINVWTVDNLTEMRHLIDLNVDGIITNTPDVLRNMLREHQTTTNATT